MTGKSLRFAFAALMLAAAVSCSKDGLFSNGSKASIKVKSIDLTGAQGLMVMLAPEDAATKAGDEAEPQVLVNKLFTVDENGNVSVAVFTFEADGIKKDKNWEEAECRLQLVPEQMEVLDNGLILLNQVRLTPPSLYSQQKDKVKQALDEVTMASSYILRPSDGALFPLNLFIVGNTVGKCLISSSSSEDGKTVALSYYYGEMFPVFSENNFPIYFATVTDKGNEIELRFNDSPTFYEAIFPNIAGIDPFTLVGFLRSDKIVFFKSTSDFCTDKGMWLLDMDLNPHFYDFTPNASSLISSVVPDPYFVSSDKDCVVKVFVYDRDLYRLILSDGTLRLYKFVFANDVADLEQLCSCAVNSNFYYTWTFKIDYIDTPSGGFKTISNGFEILDVGNTTIKYDKNANQLSYTSGFPEGFPESRLDYNSEGISYAISDNLDMIDRYDINTVKHSSYPVNWGPGGKAPFVSSNCYIDQVNGMCTVSGFTREATKMTFVIDLETGNVTSTDISEYSGSVVQSFARLN